MNPPAEWRLRLAREIAEAYARHPKVAAIGVGGSVARGNADRYSDIDLGMYWSEPPGDAERDALAATIGAMDRRDYGWNEEYGEWAEDYLVRGVKVDLTHLTVETTKRFLDDVLMRFDTEDFKQDLASVIRYAIPLHGEDVLSRWGARVATYPPGLAHAMVRRHLHFGPRAWVEMLAARDDYIALHEVYGLAAKAILASLAGLNHIYHRAGDKWMDALIAEMNHTPRDLSTRLKAVFRTHPPEGVAIMHELIEETIALVELRMLDVDTSSVRARVHSPRPVWDGPPP